MRVEEPMRADAKDVANPQAFPRRRESTLTWLLEEQMDARLRGHDGNRSS